MSKQMMDQKSLQIKEDGKFFNRIMSKENTSSRHYYVGASGSVPFMWESQPGTPKHALFSDNSSLIPPLTPPPSYCNKSSMQMMNNDKNNRRSKSTTCLNNILLSWKNIMSSSSSLVSPSSSLSCASPSSNSSPSSSRSSSWSSSSIMSKNHPQHHCRRRLYQCFSLKSGDYDGYEEEEEDHEQVGAASGPSSNSTLMSFGAINKGKKDIVVKGYCRFGNVKSALLCIAGRRSA